MEVGQTVLAASPATFAGFQTGLRGHAHGWLSAIQWAARLPVPPERVQGPLILHELQESEVAGRVAFLREELKASRNN
jgi:hypothetical protein